jgi:HK97 gp10 family phage protein
MSVKYENKFEEAYKEIGQAIADGLQDAAELLATNIGKNTPVLTGNLRSQIRPTGVVNRLGLNYSTSVETQVEYAKYVEYGTSRMKARGMFRNGADESVNPILSLLSNKLPS